MSRFNLNTPVDFAKLTAGSTAGLLQNFLGKNPNEWDIVEGSYIANIPNPPPGRKPVLFHIFKSNSAYQGELSRVTDTGGRRKVKYVFPYTDGQTTDDTGRKPQQIVLDIVIHGSGYKAGLQKLLNELLQPYPGTLLHPVLGTFTCVMEDYELVHSAEQRNAVGIHLTMVEHNFTIGQFADPKFLGKPTTTSALSKCLAFLGDAQALFTKISGQIAFVTSLKTQLTQIVAAYQNQFNLTLGNINQSFNAGAASTLPSFLPVNQGGNQNAGGVIVNSTFQTVASPSDPFQNSTLATQAALQSVLNPQQAITAVNGVRASALQLIQALETSDPGGNGSLIFYDDIIALKNSVNNISDALEIAIANSENVITNYVTPRVMSVREVAFANNLTPDQGQTILDLNRALILSNNYIDMGVTLQVPVGIAIPRTLAQIPGGG